MSTISHTSDPADYSALAPVACAGPCLSDVHVDVDAKFGTLFQKAVFRSICLDRLLRVAKIAGRLKSYNARTHESVTRSIPVKMFIRLRTTPQMGHIFLNYLFYDKMPSETDIWHLFRLIVAVCTEDFAEIAAQKLVEFAGPQCELASALTSVTLHAMPSGVGLTLWDATNPCQGECAETESPVPIGDASQLRVTILYRKPSPAPHELTKRQLDTWLEMTTCIGDVDRFFRFVKESQEKVSGRTIDLVMTCLQTAVYSYLLAPAEEPGMFRLVHDPLEDGAFRFSLNESYHCMLSIYTKSLFDCFARGTCVTLDGKNGPRSIALCQLPFFWWLRKYDIVTYIRGLLDKLQPIGSDNRPVRRKSTRRMRDALIAPEPAPRAYTQSEYDSVFGIPPWSASHVST